jgi:DNA repair photolyase
MMTPMATRTPIRWRLADDDGGQPALFGDAVPGRRDLPAVEYLHVRAQRIISRVPEGARVPFRFTINPYRGCSHACTYCFARPTHEYLGLDGGKDFEERIVVKINAVERLRAELADPKWAGETIALGTNTDPYQPCEGRYRLTRGIAETLTTAGNPFSILTKSTMIVRDRDVLAEAAGRGLFRAAFSVGTLDEGVWRMSEPGTPAPARRLEALSRLADVGIPCSVLVAPILPGLSDDLDQLEEVVRAAFEAGAVSVTPIVLHLRPGVRELFMPWLQGVRPDLVDRYERLYHRRAGYAHEHHARIAAHVQQLADQYGGAMATPAAARGALMLLADAPARPSRWQADQLAIDLGAA